MTTDQDKAPILSSEQILERIRKLHGSYSVLLTDNISDEWKFEAQRNADHEYYTEEK